MKKVKTILRMNTDIENQMDIEKTNLKDYRERCKYNVWDSCGVICFGICILLTLFGFFAAGSYFINRDYDTRDHIDHYYIVRDGYWIDKDRWCSVEYPCKMSCHEYDRFDVQCAKDNIDCIGGHYNSCDDSLRGESQDMNGWLDY